ncbi:type IV secretion protein Rhs [Myroides sp. 1354]|uniref:type IV secretion protein Rhs n=1 Tax=unclassified Myroides TaxID=2642485 RepID=UPI002575BA5F|nr:MULTISPECIES: type IV secretion protein Rhs [unclassified Myroides]MDM1044965.1 type IV secretion protein Rhs [Myroides sp. R163-1]MDM1055678.1 type IV secretion protein Rhs [Myroides sp. 1354]MDM1068975.1 type IV secretion protein Rhs [Myroides sp. 1372]
MWLSVDPLAEKMPNYNPYVYTYNNPIMFTDPTGMIGEEVIIKGEKKQEAFEQLKASTKLNLTMDANGKVGTDNTKAKSKSDKKLLEAINSTNVQVNVNATDSNYNSSGRWIVGGSYEGSEVDESGVVQTMQTVNPSQTDKIDGFYKMKKGTTMKHEVLESYLGGIRSPGLGQPTEENTSNYDAYLNAHNDAMRLDKKFKEPNVILDPKGVYISKKPYIEGSKKKNPEILINNLKR